MPIVISQTPSSVVQYPPPPQNMAHINAANMFGFVNQNPNKEADMAAMLALVQLLGQNKNNEFAREENALDRELKRQDLEYARKREDNNFETLMTQMKNQHDVEMRQMANVERLTGAQLEQNKMQNQAIARAEVRDLLNTLASSKAASTEASIASEQQQSEAQAMRGAVSGSASQKANELQSLTDAMARVAGGQGKLSDLEGMGSDLIPETRRIVEAAKNADPATGMAMLAAQRERINQFRSAVTQGNMIPKDKLRSLPRIVSTWWNQGDSFADKRKQYLNSVADQADMYMQKAAGIPIPGSSAPEAVMAQRMPELLSQSAQKRQASAQDIERMRANLFSAMSSGSDFGGMLSQAMTGGTAMASPGPRIVPAAPRAAAAPTPESQPSEFDPFLKGLYMGPQ